MMPRLHTDTQHPRRSQEPTIHDNPHATCDLRDVVVDGGVGGGGRVGCPSAAAIKSSREMTTGVENMVRIVTCHARTSPKMSIDQCKYHTV
jgi:hypothetical protein